MKLPLLNLKTLVVTATAGAGLTFALIAETGAEAPVEAAPMPVPTSSVATGTDFMTVAIDAKGCIERGLKFLLSRQQDNGSWLDNPAVTALAVYAMLKEPAYNPDLQSDRAILAGLNYILAHAQPDGGIHAGENVNYNTAICLVALVETGRPEYAGVIRRAKDFLILTQFDETEGYDENHVYYGGIGYGSSGRPDLSNTQFALEAIRAAERYEGILPTDSRQIETDAELGLHWQKALIFLSRCQNVQAINDQDFAGDDGGFMYETGTHNPERSHSYGSMTYAGAKSLLYARLTKDDVRVQRAMEWISQNYTYEENPGFGQAALFYYFMTKAKALDAYGEDTLVDATGQARPWRVEYLDNMIKRQREDGSWINTENGRYWENVPELITAHAITGMKFALGGE